MKKHIGILIGVFFTFLNFARAEVGTVDWAERDSKVICGGMVDDVDLNFRTVTANELLAAESSDGRILLYLDLHKPGQVRAAFNEGLTDAEADQREALLAKLSPEEAELIRKLSSGRQSDFYLGLTEGYFLLQTSSRGHSMSLSCKEISNVH